MRERLETSLAQTNIAKPRASRNAGMTELPANEHGFTPHIYLKADDTMAGAIPGHQSCRQDELSGGHERQEIWNQIST